MSYPKRLIDFRAWSKAMEAGAVMDRPEYRKTAKAGSSRTRLGRKRPRRRRSTHPRRMRQKNED